MAIRVDYLLEDDLDGSVSPDVATVMFGLDGATYAIDLTAANADRLRQRLATFIDAARQIGSGVHTEGGVSDRPAC